jgi:hypothetical protein
MTMSWHTMMEFEPPLIGCVVSNRNFTFNILKATKECVLNIPTVEMAVKVVGCGNTSGRKVDKFKTYGLTAAPASQVTTPLIAECFMPTSNAEQSMDRSFTEPSANHPSQRERRVHGGLEKRCETRASSTAA